MEVPRSKRGYKCLLVGIDLYTKFGHAMPLRNKTSATVAQALEGSILATLPKIPTNMLTVGGPEFRGSPFRYILETYVITYHKSIPYAPHTNGCVERLNRTIKSRLSTACHDAQHEWARQIYVIMSQYNQLLHSETGKAPAEFFVEGLAKPDVPMKSTLWKTGKKISMKFEVQDLVLRNAPYQPARHRNKSAPKFDSNY